MIYLADHSQQLLAREQFLVALWGPEWKGEEYYGVLYSAMHRLFRALGPARVMIVNNHGLGYLFEPEGSAAEPPYMTLPLWPETEV